jgi:hypothetical protein
MLVQDDRDQPDKIVRVDKVLLDKFVHIQELNKQVEDKGAQPSEPGQLLEQFDKLQLEEGKACYKMEGILK